MPIAVRSIGGNAFERCVSIKSVVVPVSCTSIGGDAFRECSMLSSVELPSGLKKIGGGAFMKCASLNEVVLKSPTPPGIGSNTFKGVNSCRFIVPKGSKERYYNDKKWAKVSSIFIEQ